MNRKDLLALTLVGPPRDNPELDPLAVLHLDNQLFMCSIVVYLCMIFVCMLSIFALPGLNKENWYFGEGMETHMAGKKV